MPDFSEGDVERASDGKFSSGDGAGSKEQTKTNPAHEAGRSHGLALLAAAKAFEKGVARKGDEANALAEEVIHGDLDPLAAGKAAFAMAGIGDEGRGGESARDAGRRHGESMGREDEDDHEDERED